MRDQSLRLSLFPGKERRQNDDARSSCPNPQHLRILAVFALRPALGLSRQSPMVGARSMKSLRAHFGPTHGRPRARLHRPDVDDPAPLEGAGMRRGTSIGEPVPPSAPPHSDNNRSDNARKLSIGGLQIDEIDAAIADGARPPAPARTAGR